VLFWQKWLAKIEQQEKQQKKIKVNNPSFSVEMKNASFGQ
jgi:hypothetical protein